MKHCLRNHCEHNGYSAGDLADRLELCGFEIVARHPLRESIRHPGPPPMGTEA